MQDPMIPQLNRVDTTPDVATSAKVGGPSNNQEGWRGIVTTILILVAAPLIALLLINFVFQSYEVDGPSMETTLQNQDRLIVNKIPRTWARITNDHYIPRRGDIIIFVKHDFLNEGISNDKQLIKRVVGLPGERVVVKDGELTVYNKQNPGGFNPDKSAPYGKSIETTPGNVDIVVGKDEVFVVGDNRPNSLDSRSFGPVNSDEIIGKLSFRIFPIDNAQHF